MSTKILVADNNPQRKGIIEAAFDDEGFLLSFAQNGKEAVPKYDAFKPTFFIANDELEDISGIKLFRILKKSGKIKENQFILLTRRDVDASSFPEDIHLLGKPFKTTDIAHLIEEMTMERMSSDEFDEKEAEMDAIVQNLRKGNEEIMREIDTSTLAASEPVMELSAENIVQDAEPTSGLEVIDDLLEADEEELRTIIDEDDLLGNPPSDDISSSDASGDDLELAPSSEDEALPPDDGLGDILDLSDAQFAQEVEKGAREEAPSSDTEEEKAGESVEESLLNYYAEEGTDSEAGAEEEPCEGEKIKTDEEASELFAEAEKEAPVVAEEEEKPSEGAGSPVDDSPFHHVNSMGGMDDLSFGEELSEEDLQENELAGKDIDESLIDDEDISLATPPVHPDAGSFEADIAHHVRKSLDGAIQKEVQQAVGEAFPEIVKKIEAEINRIAPDIIRQAIQEEIARLKGE